MIFVLPLKAFWRASASSTGDDFIVTRVAIEKTNHLTRFV